MVILKHSEPHVCPTHKVELVSRSLNKNDVLYGGYVCPNPDCDYYELGEAKTTPLFSKAFSYITGIEFSYWLEISGCMFSTKPSKQWDEVREISDPSLFEMLNPFSQGIPSEEDKYEVWEDEKNEKTGRARFFVGFDSPNPIIETAVDKTMVIGELFDILVRRRGI